MFISSLISLSRLNGIFGNADLIFHHIECVESMLIRLKEAAYTLDGMSNNLSLFLFNYKFQFFILIFVLLLINKHL